MSMVAASVKKRRVSMFVLEVRIGVVGMIRRHGADAAARNGLKAATAAAVGGLAGIVGASFAAESRTIAGTNRGQ